MTRTCMLLAAIGAMLCTQVGVANAMTSKLPAVAATKVDRIACAGDRRTYKDFNHCVSVGNDVRYCSRICR